MASENTSEAEERGTFFWNYREDIPKAAKFFAVKVARESTCALELTADLLTAAARGNPKTIAPPAPPVMKFGHRGKNYSSELLLMKKCDEFEKM